jgi:hypothetical protein
MSSSYTQSTGSILSKFLPLIIGLVVVLALLIGGFMFARNQLAAGETKMDSINTYIRPTNSTTGNKNSNLKFVYLFDFSCPACEGNADNMTKTVEAFSDKVEFVFKTFVVHPGNGTRNALAANAAGLQGQYLPYHDKLMALAKAGNGTVSATEQDNLAKEMGLDVTKFRKDAESVELENQLKLDQADIRNAIVPPSEYSGGKSLKPEATPSVVLVKDGKVVTWWSGAIPLEDTGDVMGVRSRVNKVLGEQNVPAQSQATLPESSSVTLPNTDPILAIPAN